MKKRIRKKKHCGEFLELGFALRISFKEGIDEIMQADIILQCVDDVVVPNDLTFGGDPDSFCVSKKGLGSVTEEEKRLLSDWWCKHESVEKVQSSAFVDVWNEGFENLDFSPVSLV